MLIIIVSGITHTRAALAINDKIIKQRIEEEATGSFRLRGKSTSPWRIDTTYCMVGFNIQKMLFEQIAWKAKGVAGRMYEIE